MKSASCGLLFACSMALGQTLTFEVASIRPAPTERPFSPADGPFFCPFGCFNTGRMKVDGARMDIAFMPLDELIRRAYRIRPDQLDGPDWMRDQHFDVLANIPEGASANQVPEMLQALLAERFKLAAHHETRPQPVYELRVDNGGPKLKQSAEAVPSDDPADRTMSSPQGSMRARQVDGGLLVTSGPWGPMRMLPSAPDSNTAEIELSAATMPLLADALSQFMDHPVIDATKLKGVYRITLSTQDINPFLLPKFLNAKLPPRPGAAPNPADGPASASDPTGGSTIFKTLEKLGLKLERTKAPIEILVVDHLEKSPTEN